MPDLAAPMPSALKANARWRRLGPNEAVPALLAHPDWDSGRKVPLVLWMHGRTVNKELDPGRYLRWMRADIGTCAVDLPGHGERHEPDLQQRERVLFVIRQMADEIDGVIQSLAAMNVFDMDRLAIGGMSGGGMAALVRLTRPHPFQCASVEATSGSWEHLLERSAIRRAPADAFHAINPIENLQSWREIPFQAIHSRGDEWMPYESQEAFIDELRRQYSDPELIEFVTYNETGAPYEHVGFGRKTADAKNRQLAFLKRWLAPPQ